MRALLGIASILRAVLEDLKDRLVMCFEKRTICRPNLSLNHGLFDNAHDVGVLAQLDNHIAVVSTFKHVPEVARERIRFLGLPEGHGVVMHLVPISIRRSSLSLDLPGQSFICNRSWQLTLILNEFTPLSDPLAADEKVCKTALYFSQPVGRLQRMVEVQFLLNAAI